MKSIKVNDEEIRNEFRRVVDINSFIDKILELLHRYATEEYKQHILRIVPDSGKVYGTPAPVLKSLARHVGAYTRSNPGLGIFLLRKMWERGSREEKRISCEALAHLYSFDQDIPHRLVMEWIPDLDNWEICDVLATSSFKPFIMQNPEKTHFISRAMVKSLNPWVRRFGLVSLIPLIHDDAAGSVESFLGVLKFVMEDADANVQKAVAWVLRELTRVDEFRVKRFLMSYAGKTNTHTRWMIKEGSKKMNESNRREILDKLGK